MKKRVLELQSTLNELREQRQHTEEQWANTNTDTDTKQRIDTALDEILINTATPQSKPTRRN